MENCTIGGYKIDLAAFTHEYDTDGINCNDHSSRAGSIRAASIVMVALVALFVGLRVFSRAYFLRNLFMDDGLILVACAFNIGFASVNLIAIQYGLGRHLWDVSSSDDITSCVKFLMVSTILGVSALAFTKASIIASYLRFITDSKFRIAMCATGVVIVGSWICMVFVTIFQCNPVEGAWNNFTGKTATCIFYTDFVFASLAINLATDLVLSVLPWPYLWKLAMPPKQKIILCLLLSGGAAASIVGILRLCYTNTLRTMDVTYKSSTVLILSLLECSIGIICVSIPPLRPMVARIFPSALVSRSPTDESPLTDISHPRRVSMVREIDGLGQIEANGQLKETNVHLESSNGNSEGSGDSITLYQSSTGQILAHSR